MKKYIAQRIRIRKKEPHQWYEVVPEGTTAMVMELCEDIKFGGVNMNPKMRLIAFRLREVLVAAKEQVEADNNKGNEPNE